MSVFKALKSVVKEEGEMRLLSNLNLVLYRMKGGTYILAYEIFVSLGIILLIVFLTCRAQTLGISKRNAFLFGLFLWGDIELFPWAFRSGWLIYWILSIIILVFLGTIWLVVRKGKTKEKVLASNIKVHTGTREITSKIQVNTDEVVEAVEAVASSDNVEEFTTSMLIDELIDLGFNEKNSENFEQAVFYFSWALSLEPMPDLAFYLMIDCYWLWNNLGMRDYALTQLRAYVQKYLPQFNTQLRYQFETWMTKEDLHKMFE